MLLFLINELKLFVSCINSPKFNLLCFCIFINDKTLSFFQTIFDKFIKTDFYSSVQSKQQIVVIYFSKIYMNVCLHCTKASYGKETIRRLSDVLRFNESFALKIYDVGTISFFF